MTFTITSVLPCLLVNNAGYPNTVFFQATGVPNVKDMEVCLGGTMSDQFTAANAIPASPQGWYSTVLTGTVFEFLGEDGQEYTRPYLSFGADITITITSGGLDSNTYPIPCFVVSSIDG